MFVVGVGILRGDVRMRRRGLENGRDLSVICSCAKELSPNLKTFLYILLHNLPITTVGHLLYQEFLAFSCTGSHLLLWSGSRATREEILLNGIPKLLNCCIIFVMSMYMIAQSI